ncbi:MAG TPA: DUF1330 domain-containing protein [Vicinamibacterales bacterium]|nr:DUF1330 domain-containing protein [Vicinamibacterales bacterium]
MKAKMFLYSTGLIAMFVLGHVSARIGVPVAHAQGGGEKAAYLIASTSPAPNAPERAAAYSKAAGPLAKNAGMQLLGAGEGNTIQVLEGTFPYKSRLVVEKFRSMKALLDFWKSPAYQEAKKNRNEANFIIAVEAVE